MLGRPVRVLNFDNSIIRQEGLFALFHPLVTDLVHIGPLCRMWLGKRTADEIKDRLKPEFKNCATLLGSSDFHHISRLLIDQFNEPINVIIFDHHPDWDVLTPRLSCGSWVTAMLKKENIKKCVLLGVSSDDISTLSIQTGNLRSLKDDRVEIYPYRHRPTKTIFKKIPKNISIRMERHGFCNNIYWHELKGKDLKDFFLQMIKRFKTKQVYVSIDKDCLKRAFSLTNWEEGFFSLDELLLLLGLIKENLDIVGLDITGDYSAPEIKGRIKTMCSFFDHPKRFSAKGRSDEFINSINEKTNIKILELLCAAEKGRLF